MLTYKALFQDIRGDLGIFNQTIYRKLDLKSKQILIKVYTDRLNINIIQILLQRWQQIDLQLVKIHTNVISNSQFNNLVNTFRLSVSLLIKGCRYK